MPSLWRRSQKFLASTLAAIGITAPAAASEIVVAMRYLQQTGASHSHLYLYREDGKLLRQLTNDAHGQDRDPTFRPDGEMIVFTRELTGGATQYWSIEPRGGGLKRLPAAPEWYVQTKSSLVFEPMLFAEPDPPEGNPTTAVDLRTISLPDDRLEVRIKPAPGADSEGPESWEVFLHPLDGGPETKAGDLPGYSARFLALPGDGPKRCVLSEGPLKAAFCFVHVNSTEGDTVYALDLRAKRLTNLSPNSASPYPLPGEAAFLTLAEERYVPFGDGAHTANCSSVERWDIAWKPVRYAREKAPGICFGASLYRPGLTPSTVNIRQSR